MTVEFDKWADYYDIVHQGLPGEAEFYVGQAVRIGGKVLELGCGTGRISIPMAMSGVDVTGLDNSSPMLDVCRAKLSMVGEVAGNLTLVEGDMSRFELGARFDLVAIPYRAFMHLHRRDQQRGCLECIRAHMEESGVLILNTWVPSAAIIAKNAPEAGEKSEYRFVDEYEVDDSGEVVRHHHAAEYDAFRQRIVERHIFEHVGGDDRIIHSETVPMLRVWTTPRELENLVELCGFSVDAVFGDFDCAPLTEKSREMIWVLRRDA